MSSVFPPLPCCLSLTEGNMPVNWSYCYDFTSDSCCRFCNHYIFPATICICNLLWGVGCVHIHYPVCVGTVKVFQEVIVTQLSFIEAYFPNNQQFLWSAALLTSWVISYLPCWLETWNLSCHIKNNLTGKPCRVVVELVVELLRQTSYFVWPTLTDSHCFDWPTYLFIIVMIHFDPK